MANVDQKVFSRTLAQRVTDWADDFLMLSAIKADSRVTAMTVITHPPGGLHNQFLVLGDAKGKLYAFNTRGQLALEHDAGADNSPADSQAHLPECFASSTDCYYIVDYLLRLVPLIHRLSEPVAGGSIQCLAASVYTQDKSVIAVGLANGNSQVLQLQLSNR